ncbi:alpha/beta fold hydrolase [Aeromicrobium sp.]|nr:alpha/beta fold hydrolase [Candidatus Saccharibacteria bacterium]
MTPDTYTNSEQMLDVDDIHTLYTHDWGNKDAKTPILFLHGGPGGGCSDSKKQQFDPATQRVIFFDQRGSGRSLPYGELKQNTTGSIISDMIVILEHFGIDTAILTGGSWGSALAFMFAIAHPDRVSALLIDGVWTGSKDENAWIDAGGFKPFFPDAWQQYLNGTPVEHHNNPSEYHFQRIMGPDAEATKQSAYAYETLEGAVMSLDDRKAVPSYETYDPSSTRIEVHYLVHGCFVPDRYVFNNTTKLTMPVYMVQGRYDMVCPPRAAYELHGLLPHSTLIWTTSGHSAERETWAVKRTILAQLTA